MDMNNEQYDNHEALVAVNDENQKYMEVAHLMTTMPHSNPQPQGPSTYVYVNDGEPVDETMSKITLDRALVGGPDDDIPSKLYVPPAPGTNGTTTSNDVGRHLDKSVENDQELEKYHALMHKFYALKAEQAAEDEDDHNQDALVIQQPQQQSPSQHSRQTLEYPSDGIVVLNSPPTVPMNQRPPPPPRLQQQQPPPRLQQQQQQMQEYQPQHQQQMHERAYIREDLEQPLLREDPEVHSNEFEVEENVMEYDEGDRQHVFRSSSSPMIHSSSREIFGDEPESNRQLVVVSGDRQHQQQIQSMEHQQQLHLQARQRKSEIDKLEDSFDMVPISDKPRGFWQKCFVPSCCFFGGVMVTMAILLLFNFLDLEIAGYEFSIDSKSESDGRAAPVPNATHNATPNPTQPPTTSPPSTSAPTFGGPPPEPLSVSVSQNLNSADLGFGSSVAVSGRWFGVGAPGSSTVSVFRQDGAGTLVKLPDVDGVAGSSFGADIDVGLAAPNDNSGDALMIVGAPENGAAYLYSLHSQSGGSWDPLGSPLTGSTQRLRRSLTSIEDRFGATVALEAGRAVVGAPLSDESFENAGSVFVYHVGQSDFSLHGTSANARFGEDVSISPSGNTIVVGEPGSSSFVIFEWNGSDWERVFSETFAQDIDCGSSVTFISEKYVVIGAPSFNIGGGRLRFFQRGSHNMWIQLPSLAGQQGNRIGAFGTVSGTEGDYGPEIVVSKSSGGIKRYDLFNGAWVERFVQSDGVTATSVAVLETENEYTVFAGYSGIDRAVLYEVQELALTDEPTSSPSSGPTTKPTPHPTAPPGTPTVSPSSTPSQTPSTDTPTSSPSNSPTGSPTTLYPTISPTEIPTASPTQAPTPRPTVPPGTPTIAPSFQPSDIPSDHPSPHPTDRPTVPDGTPTEEPSSAEPTSAEPTDAPTNKPTFHPTPMPTARPTSSPTNQPQWTLISSVFTGSGLNTGHGSSVSIAGGFMAVGEPKGASVGQVGVYGSDPSWSRLASVVDFNAKAFGSAVDLAIVGGQPSLLAGAPDTKDSFYNTRFGSVAYYEFDNGGVWTQLGSTLNPGSVFYDAAGNYGGAVAMAHTIRRFAVAAPDSSFDSDAVDTGKIYSYQYDSDWTAMTTEPIVGDAGSLLGSSIDMSRDGTRLLAGAPGGRNGDGSVFLYEWNDATDTWDLLVPYPGGFNETFGASVAIISDDGSTFAVGGPSRGNDEGVIRVYQQMGGIFQQLGPEILGSVGERIGTTLAGAQGRIAFGTNTGSFHVYEYSGSQWREVASGPDTGSAVTSIDISEDGNTVAVGVANEESMVYSLQ